MPTQSRGHGRRLIKTAFTLHQVPSGRRDLRQRTRLGSLQSPNPVVNWRAQLTERVAREVALGFCFSFGDLADSSAPGTVW